MFKGVVYVQSKSLKKPEQLLIVVVLAAFTVNFEHI